MDITQYLDNTGKITGLQRFIREFMAGSCVNLSPDFHDNFCREMLMSTRIAEVDSNFKRINVIKPSKYNNFNCIVAYRGSAKTTMATMAFPTYIIAFKGQTSYLRYKGKLYECLIEDDLIVIYSKTLTHAQERTEAIRSFIMGSSKFTHIFGDFKPQRIIDQYEPNRKDLFRTKNGIYIVPRGAGQQTRGINIGQNTIRTTRAIFDDIYEEDKVLTKESREKIGTWFWKQAINSIDDVRGKATLIGTIVHESTVPVEIREESLKKNSIWRYYEQPIIDAGEFEWILEQLKYDNYTMKFDMPDDDVILRLQDQCRTIAWQDRQDLKHILNTFRTQLMERTIDGFYQEFLNRMQSPDNKKFNQNMFTKKELRLVKKNNIPYVYIVDEDRYVNVNIYGGVDLASAENSRADDTVIITIGHGSDDQIYVIQYIKGKMGPRDETWDKSTVDTFRKEKRNIRKRGVVDEILRKNDEFGYTFVIIECIADQKKVLQDVKRVARINNVAIRVEEFRPTTNKLERMVNVLLGRYQTHTIIHNLNMLDLEHQLEDMGKAAHDDIPDALHVAVMFSRRPGYIPYNEKKEVENVFGFGKPVRDWRQL